ncbi:MAG: hypothetical protein ACNI26_02945 [Terasakiella sp.]|uniref:hypothetical protein n=1 Tax=unclassified Terasakiella TaxID=2614952 RepID=UPI003B00C1DB
MSTPPKEGSSGTGSTSIGGVSAFAQLMNLGPDTDKVTLMEVIDNAVTQILSELANHEEGDLTPDILVKVQTALSFLEKCLAFKDQEFSSFARKRAGELENALANTIKRIQVAQRKPVQQQAPAQSDEQAQSPQAAPKEEKIKQVTPLQADEPIQAVAKGFLYEREEKILIDYAYKRLCKRLAFLRGDSIVVEKGKAVDVSGIHEDGVAPLFLLSPRFPEILRQPFVELIREKRDLLSRRVYGHTDRSDSDEEVLRLYSEDRYRDIDGIIGLAFDDWAGEIARAGIAGLPQEIKVLGGKKKDESSGGLGSSLKKVFAFGKKEKKESVKGKTQEKETTPIRVHKEWQKLESQGVFNLSQHFSFGLLSYALQLSEKQFETEYECISQIVNQQEEPDVGPVVSNLSRLYKFYDNIFFDLVIVVLFQRKNKFDINMLQAACMSQNFVVDRLPLTMDELRRRPMEHVKYVLSCLNDTSLNPEKLKSALEDYFFVHETVHASKVGKRIQASENLLKRQGDKLKGSAKQIVDEIQTILGEIKNLKKEQEEEGVFLGEEIQTTIDEGIERALLFIR